jgi:hypothetical protein
MLMCIREVKPEDARLAAFLIQLAIQDIAEALTGETEELDKPVEERLRNKEKNT